MVNLTRLGYSLTVRLKITTPYSALSLRIQPIQAPCSRGQITENWRGLRNPSRAFLYSTRALPRAVLLLYARLAYGGSLHIESTPFNQPQIVAELWQNHRAQSCLTGSSPLNSSPRIEPRGTGH